jgi:hypothetical protein
MVLHLFRDEVSCSIADGPDGSGNQRRGDRSSDLRRPLCSLPSASCEIVPIMRYADDRATGRTGDLSDRSASASPFCFAHELAVLCRGLLITTRPLVRSRADRCSPRERHKCAQNNCRGSGLQWHCVRPFVLFAAICCLCPHMYQSLCHSLDGLEGENAKYQLRILVRPPTTDRRLSANSAVGGSF